MTQQSDPNTRTPDANRRLAVDRGNALNLDRILVPLSGSHQSEQILPFASMMTDWFSGELTLFHTLPSTHPARGARPGQVHYPDAPHDRGASLAAAYLEEVVSRLGPHGVKSRWGIATGHASTMITSRSATSSFGIVAVASAPYPRAKRLFTPGLVDQLWKTTAVPLLMVNPRKTDLNGVPPRAPEKLIMLSGPRTSRSALSIASAVAGASRATLTVVTVGAGADDAYENELFTTLSVDGINAEIERAEGNPAQYVHGLQAANPGSWIIVDSKMRSGIRRSLFGSIADHLARAAVGPIIVVPEPNVVKRRMQSAHDAMRDMATSL